MTASRRRTPLRRGVLAAALCGFTVVGGDSAAAQVPDTTRAQGTLAPAVAREVVALFNATTTLRTVEKLDIDAGRTVPGDVAVLNGPVVIAGHIAGRVLAINADVLCSCP